MYHKCTWCKARIMFEPTYYTQGFTHLAPGFEVYCGATCSLNAYQAKLMPRVSKQSNIIHKFSRDY